MTGRPTLTGDPRADRALVALARLLAEIAAGTPTAPDGDAQSGPGAATAPGPRAPGRATPHAGVGPVDAPDEVPRVMDGRER